jgi:hypothetical protein
MEREPFTQTKLCAQQIRGEMALVQRAVIEHRQQLRRGVTELELCIQIA